MNNKNKKIILIGFFLIILTGIISFLLMPSFKRIALNSKDFLDKKSELARIQGEIDNFKDFDQNNETYLSLIARMEKSIFDQVLIDGDLSLDLIEFLKNEAIKQNINIKVTPAGIDKSNLETFKISLFSLNISGSTTNCFNFISKIEHSRWLSEIEKIVITKGDGEINANFTLKVYAKN